MIYQTDNDKNQFLYNQFDISRFGFLTDPSTIPSTLPDGFEEFAEVVENIANPNGAYYRNLVDQLVKGKPQEFYKDLVKNLTFEQKKQIYSTFTFVVQKYVRCMGKNDTKTEIPYELGIVWYECSKEFGLPCVTSYGAVILYNCKLGTDNKIQSKFAISGTNDELHFYKVHMEIEACGIDVLKNIYFLDKTNKREVMLVLNQVYEVIKKITRIMESMYKGCDAKVFWKNIRHYLGGFTEDNGMPDGLKVTGTNLVFKFGGGSAAQSTLIQVIDIFLGISHGFGYGAEFLLEQRKYMPEKHRKFLEELETIYPEGFIKNFVIESNDDDLTKSFDNCVDSLALFRNVHFGIVHKYVIKFIKKDEWYETICNSIFGRTSSTTQYIMNFINTNIHGNKGSGGLPTDQLKVYVEDTKDTKIVKNSNVSQVISNTRWYYWLGLLGLFGLPVVFAVGLCPAFNNVSQMSRTNMFWRN